MSNPAVYLLAETKIQGKSVRIEDNLGEAVHVHCGELRLSLSINEFMEISSKVLEGANELLKMNGLSMDMFDMSALDWDWLERYAKIGSIRRTRVVLGDLYTQGDLEGYPGIYKIIPLAESRQLKALNGEKERLQYYKQKNRYRQSNEDRLKDVLEKIKEEGYPFDDKYIMVNQYNQIYDGDHRAACLMYLYGEKKEIPVIQVCFTDEKTLEEQKECERLAILEYKRENMLKPVEKKQWSEDPNILDVSFDEFLHKLSLQNIDYFSIDCAMKNQEDELIADRVIIIRQGKMIELCKAFQISYFGNSYYRYYKFLYSMQRAICVRLADVSIIIFDRLSCKSMFENAFVPLDKNIQAFSWNEVIFDEETSRNIAGDITTLLFVIVNGIFNKNRFDDQDISYIQRFEDILDTAAFKQMLRSIFFRYTDELVNLLTQSRYEIVVEKYVKNTNY